jgi:hypothetical protein
MTSSDPFGTGIFSRRHLLAAGGALGLVALGGCAVGTATGASSGTTSGTGGSAAGTDLKAGTYTATFESGNGGGGPGGGSATQQLNGAYLVDGVAATIDGGTWASTSADQNVFLVVNGG